MLASGLPSDSAPNDRNAWLDRRIVQETQAGLPLTSRPYARIAERVGCRETEVRERILAMMTDGRIRRVGAVPNHYRLGFVANGMSVWDIDDASTKEAGTLVGGLTAVSHCYRRPRALPDWPYNLFAMVHGRTREEVEETVDTIRAKLGARVRAFDILYSTRILKKTGLRIR
jgi:DNA-binding Lrp family transcriptional regulator